MYDSLQHHRHSNQRFLLLHSLALFKGFYYCRYWHVLVHVFIFIIFVIQEKKVIAYVKYTYKFRINYFVPNATHCCELIKAVTREIVSVAHIIQIQSSVCLV